MSTREAWYTFYSNQKLTRLESDLRQLADRIGYQVEVSWFEDRQFFFFFENEGMLNRHDQQGYQINHQGKGCFCVELQQVDFHGKVPLEEVNGKEDFFIKIAHFYLQNIVHCFLTLPAPIEESNFAYQIYDALEKLLGDGASDFGKE